MIKVSIPYRGMPKSKQRMLQILESFSDDKDVQFQIVEQSEDGRRFNLGKMINVGFDLFSKASDTDDWTYFFHPIDLFPKQGFAPYRSGAELLLQNKIDICSYNIPEKDLHYRSCSYRPDAYRKFNGYTNNFWGWGAEDDEFFNRVRMTNLRMGHIKLLFDTWCEVKEDHEPDHPSPDYILGLEHHAKNLSIAWSLTEEKMKQDGLSNLSYRVLSRELISQNLEWISVDISVEE